MSEAGSLAGTDKRLEALCVGHVERAGSQMLRWGRSYYADPTGLIWQEDRGHKAMRGRKCQGAHREEKQEVPRWENERKSRNCLIML